MSTDYADYADSETQCMIRLMVINSNFPVLLISLILFLSVISGNCFGQTRVKTANGVVEGTVDKTTGVRTFKGVPFAAPPVGKLRWQPPQAIQNWNGTLKAEQFGPRCMQRSIYSDMVFRSNGMSEDCLYLNVWRPASAATCSPSSGWP